MCLQNVVLYNGNAKDREMIRDHEFKYKSGNTNNRFGRSAARQSKFNVLLASYEMVRKDKKVFQVRLLGEGACDLGQQARVTFCK